MTSSRLALAGGPVLAEGLKPRLWPILSEEAKLAVRRVLDRGILSGASSPESRAFEEEFAEYVGARYCLLTHCGTSALELALVGAGVQAGDEVIVPAYSFVATAVAVLRVGAVPMFADVLPGSGNIDPKCVEAQITPRTKAIMPVHVHGCPSDLAELAAIAEKHQLVIVEDAAQAHGATYQGKAVGALFAGGGFSLQGSKNLSAGEGGAYVTNSESAAAIANSVRGFGQKMNYEPHARVNEAAPLDGAPSHSVRFGHMYRGNEMMAALARVQLKELPAYTAAAQENAKYFAERVNQLSGFHVSMPDDSRSSVFHKMRVQFDRQALGLGDISETQIRDLLIRTLSAEGVGAVYWQTDTLPQHPLFHQEATESGVNWPWPDERRSNARQSFPIAEGILASSFVMFSQSSPLIAQDRASVKVSADAVEKVWNGREQLRELLKA